jgi:hypothetical protein
MEGHASRPSPNQIKSILSQLKTRMFLSKNYHRPDLKQNEPCLDENSDKTMQTSLFTDSETVFIHYGLINQDFSQKDLISELIKQMWYNKTIQQKMIHGITTESHPHIFSALWAQPNPAERMVIYNVLYVDECSRIMLYGDDDDALEDEERRGAEMDIIDMDLDKKCLMDHLELLEMPWNEDSLMRYHPHFISARENSWLVKRNGTEQRIQDGKTIVKIRNTFSYPEEYINQHKTRWHRYQGVLKTMGADFDETFAKYLSSKRRRTRTGSSEQDNANFAKEFMEFIKTDTKRARDERYSFPFLETSWERVPTAKQRVEPPPPQQPAVTPLRNSITNLPPPPAVVTPEPLSSPMPIEDNPLMSDSPPSPPIVPLATTSSGEGRWARMSQTSTYAPAVSSPYVAPTILVTYKNNTALPLPQQQQQQQQQQPNSTAKPTNTHNTDSIANTFDL